VADALAPLGVAITELPLSPDRLAVSSANAPCAHDPDRRESKRFQETLHG